MFCVLCPHSIYTCYVLLFFLQHQNPTSPLKVEGSRHWHQRILRDHLRPADHHLEQEDKPVQPQERNHLLTEADLSAQQRGYYNDYYLIFIFVSP